MPLGSGFPKGAGLRARKSRAGAAAWRGPQGYRSIFDRGRTFPMMKSRPKFSVILQWAAVTMVSITVSPATALRQAPGESVPTAAQWQQDLDTMTSELSAKHKNLFASISRQEFERRAAALRSEIPHLAPQAVLVGLMRIAAAAGDAHTGVAYVPRRAVPIMTYWFADGIYVFATIEEYRDLLDAAVVAVGGRPVEEVIERIAEIVPHENRAQVRLKAVNDLSSPDLLYGLGVIPSAESVSLTVRKADGTEVTRNLAPVDMTSRPAWIGASRDPASLPLYQKDRSTPYWFQALPESRAVYVKYNSCRDVPDRPFAAFVRDVFAAVDANHGWRLVVDIRNNGGGNSAVFDPFLEALDARPAFKTKGRLYVIIGRQTFSSALLNALSLKKRTAAVFVGEPTGGKPNHFGEVQTFKLPNSGLTVSFSVKYFKEVDGDPDSLYPDITVEPSFADFQAGRDPVLERILKD
jgi:hypothetical protein